jgi:alpha-amylase
MIPPLRLCLALHNHQPVGNFDHVFEQAYQDSYLPFLEVFEPYDDLKIALHTSGPLIEWLDERHGEYLDRVAALVDAGRIEILGGPFYEPILTMIPSRDRIGQITEYTRWLEQRFGTTVQGMWMPERVWEQALTRDLVEAGMKYSILDDYHFTNAGLADEQLYGYYVTEDDGRVMCILPGSERLRYTIPFAAPHESIDYLRGIAEAHPDSVMIFGDDGEKFGTWPETKRHVYDNGWLRQFFDALVQNRDWLHTTTLAEATENVPPVGKIFLPCGSYREMSEWALPVERQQEYEALVHELEHDPRWGRIKQFFRGGFWRNFRAKYPEANEMYARMMISSRRVAQAQSAGANGDGMQWARRELYRGQCNCAYWHGAFGGIYLPHLRNAVFNHLIAAENLVDEAEHRQTPWVEATADDYNFDLRQEVRLAGDKLICLLAPAAGGMLYELDVRSICHNLLATITRRPEAYHRKVLGGAQQGPGAAASIHDRVVFKQAGLDQHLQYDRSPKKSLIEHFFDDSANLESVSRGEAEDRGDFADGVYETRIRRSADRVQVLLERQGFAGDVQVKVTKGVTLEAGSDQLQIAYLLEGLPRDRSLHFAVEFNFAGMPDGADDRYFYQGQRRKLGRLGARLDLHETTELHLVDEWLGLDVGLDANRPGGIWTFPVATVSQSEGGFELVHQSVAVLPHWHVQGDADGRWSVTLTLNFDSARARQRMEKAVAAAT